MIRDDLRAFEEVANFVANYQISRGSTSWWFLKVGKSYMITYWLADLSKNVRPLLPASTPGFGRCEARLSSGLVKETNPDQLKKARNLILIIDIRWRQISLGADEKSYKWFYSTEYRKSTTFPSIILKGFESFAASHNGDEPWSQTCRGRVENFSKEIHLEGVNRR